MTRLVRRNLASSRSLSLGRIAGQVSTHSEDIAELNRDALPALAEELAKRRETLLGESEHERLLERLAVRRREDRNRAGRRWGGHERRATEGGGGERGRKRG